MKITPSKMNGGTLKMARNTTMLTKGKPKINNSPKTEMELRPTKDPRARKENPKEKVKEKLLPANSVENAVLECTQRNTAQLARVPQTIRITRPMSTTATSR